MKEIDFKQGSTDHLIGLQTPMMYISTEPLGVFVVKEKWFEGSIDKEKGYFYLDEDRRGEYRGELFRIEKGMFGDNYQITAMSIYAHKNFFPGKGVEKGKYQVGYSSGLVILSNLRLNQARAILKGILDGYMEP